MSSRDFAIRPYRGTDEEELLALWNAAMPYDPVAAPVFRTKVLLDPNFRPEGLLVASNSDGLAGFILSLVRQVPLFLNGLEPERGWITAFGVHPAYRRQGVGRHLFTTILDRFRQMDRRLALISPYTPNYFIPGVDQAAYPEAMAFLTATGWQVVSEPISMRAELASASPSQEVIELEQRLSHQGIEIRAVTSADLPELMPFIVHHFGWDWLRFAQDYLLEIFGHGSDEICFLIATQGSRIAGYCQQRRERFGPFGVAPEFRGKGIGRLLLHRCLVTMLARGFHCAWFLWTGPQAARVYEREGFRRVRQFAVLQRDLL